MVNCGNVMLKQWFDDLVKWWLNLWLYLNDGQFLRFDWLFNGSINDMIVNWCLNNGHSWLTMVITDGSMGFQHLSTNSLYNPLCYWYIIGLSWTALVAVHQTRNGTWLVFSSHGFLGGTHHTPNDAFTPLVASASHCISVEVHSSFTMSLDGSFECGRT